MLIGTFLSLYIEGGKSKLNWVFWRKRKKDRAIVEQLAEQSAQISQGLAFLTEELGGNRQQISEIEAAVNKLSRLQYKTSQDIQGKLERLTADIGSVQQWQAAHETDRDRLAKLERQVGYAAENLISWLDDIDLVLNGLQGDSKTWGALLNQWAARLVYTLAEIGIREVDLLGHSFQPQWAESIGTVNRSCLPAAEGGGATVYEPYAVVQIVKRGLMTEDGRLLRKAQVITLKEDELD